MAHNNILNLFFIVTIKCRVGFRNLGAQFSSIRLLLMATEWSLQSALVCGLFVALQSFIAFEAQLDRDLLFQVDSEEWSPRRESNPQTAELKTRAVANSVSSRCQSFLNRPSLIMIVL